jgi:dihydropteroate synthase
MGPCWAAQRDAFLSRIRTRPTVMGILNVTPDSFSDGGRFAGVDAPVSHAIAMAAAGCDIVDIGGESTRPGAAPVAAADELARVEPVLRGLAGALAVPISIDTYKANVAARAIELGAIVVNDVWGLQKDPAMAGVIAATGAAVVIMHNRATKDADVDMVADIRRFFDTSLALAARAGVPQERIILDPGIGFAKTSRQNRDALAGISKLKDYRCPILVGASRKAFLGGLSDGSEASLVGTLAVNLAAAASGATVFRVHDVAEHVAALRVWHTLHSEVI